MTGIDRDAGLRQWLDDFAAGVRRGDYAAGRALFADEAASFGTRAVMTRGVDDLVERQWRHIWDSTRGFAFDPATVICGQSAGGDLGWIAGCWSSEGLGTEGAWFPRRGRASFVLARREGGWACVHSHHSLEPAPEPLAAIP